MGNTMAQTEFNSDGFMQIAFGAMILLIVFEIVASSIQKRNYYRWNVLIADVSTGVIFAIVGVLILAGFLVGYNHLEENFSWTFGQSFFTISNPWAWVVSLLLTDFTYYWFHRHAHTFQFLWALHVTHHSTQEMNFAVSFRGNGFQRVFEYIYFLPMALLGIPWEMFFLSHRILKVYQFIVHTRYLGKIGFLEFLMVTPSNHRVHHGTQKVYLDKNHGGIFIIWDRLFGTYAEEFEEPIYGLTKPVNSFNPITVNFHVFRDILRNLFHSKTFRDAFLCLFGPPGWKPEYLRTPADDIKEPAYDFKYDPKPPLHVMIYVTLQAIGLGIVGLFIWKVSKLDLSDSITLTAVAGIVIFSLFSINRTMEMKRWSRRTEFVRNILFSLLFVYFLTTRNLPDIEIFAWPLLFLSLVSLFWIWIKRKTFFDLSQITNSWV